MSERLDASIERHCRATVARLRGRALFAVRSGGAARTIGLADGYLPLLAGYTHEDKAAKGLRSFTGAQPAKPEAVHYSVLERVAQEPRLLLLGEQGSGKTTLVSHIALHLSGTAIGLADISVGRLCQDAIRAESGLSLQETWLDGTVVPVIVPIGAGDGVEGAIARAWQEFPDVVRSGDWAADKRDLLLFFDSIEAWGESGPDRLDEIAVLTAALPRVRVVACGETRACRDWPLPAGFAKDRVLPLLRAQRAAYVARPGLLGPGGAVSSDRVDLPGAENTALFTLSLGLKDAAGLRHPHDIVDRWQSEAPGERHDGIEAYLAARQLASCSADAIAARYATGPIKWAAPVAIAARREGTDRFALSLARALVALGGDAGLAGAVTAGGLLSEHGGASLEARPAVVAALLRLISEGRLSLSWREEAGRHLARWGDPRDLEELVDIPAGSFQMGSAAHPNSEPPHMLTLGRFRIAKYPVTNAHYRRFIDETGRTWRSTDGRLPERANAPAVDLTWFDARAFCEWLTPAWRASGRIGKDEIARLPTEPEWEKAARGNRMATGATVVYPWDGAWRADRQNAEEAGLNDTCTVGLFPAGRSVYGCADMTGQVWEWTSTLWGDDMATPSFKYPYRADGREDAQAGPRIRRVLRGGCFSSARNKACCTYRGSLEPDGFWRGNGFRVAVSTATRD